MARKTVDKDEGQREQGIPLRSREEFKESINVENKTNALPDLYLPILIL